MQVPQFIHARFMGVVWGNYGQGKGSAFMLLGTLSNDDNGGSENVAKKKNLRSFKLNHVYLDPLNMLNAGNVS